MQDWLPVVVLWLSSATVQLLRKQGDLLHEIRTEHAAGMLVLAVALLGAVGWPQGPTGRNEGAEKGIELGGPTVALGIEISLPDRAVFYVPVVGDGEILGIVRSHRSFCRYSHHIPHARRFGENRGVCPRDGQEEVIGSNMQ